MSEEKKEDLIPRNPRGGPDCYQCLHRRSLVGNAHSACHHPEIAELHNDPILQLIAVVGGAVIDLDHTLGIVGNPHGIQHGWFAWPVNFDPIWLLACNGFTQKKKQP